MYNGLYPKFIVSNQKGESNIKQRVNMDSSYGCKVVWILLSWLHQISTGKTGKTGYRTLIKLYAQCAGKIG